MTGGTALVLAGSGAPAAYFGAGAIWALEEAGERPSIVSGVSTGAINAYALGAGMDGLALARMWCRIGWRDVYRPRTDVWRAVNVGRLLRPTTNIAEYALGAVGWTWLLDPAPLRNTLTSHLGRATIDTTGDVAVVLSAVDDATAVTMRFCSRLPPRHRRDPRFRQVDLTVEHVLASVAVPLLFRPGSDDGPAGAGATSDGPARGGTAGGDSAGSGADGRDARLVDAGLVSATPLAPAMRYEPDRIIVVAGRATSRPARAPDSLGSAIALLVDNLAHAALAADVEHAHTVNRLVRVAPRATVQRDVPILLVEPGDPGFPADGLLEFSASRARRGIAYGREQTGEALAGWNRRA
jgi:predicted acylesterase/phospholipase RssA